MVLAGAAVGDNPADEMTYGIVDVVNHTGNDQLSPTTDKVVATMNMKARTADESSRG